MDNVAFAIKSQYELFLKHVLKRDPVYILRKGRSGVRCPICWDPITLEIKKSTCMSCFNTGFAGGFDILPLMYISFTEPGFTTKFDINDTDDFQQNVTAAWATGDYLINSEDILVDSLNRRFRIIQNQPTTKDGVTYLRQILNIQYIPNTDIIYKFKVPAFPLTMDITSMATMNTGESTFMFDDLEDGQVLRYKLNEPLPSYKDSISTWNTATIGMTLPVTQGDKVCFVLEGDPGLCRYGSLVNVVTL